MNRSSAEYLVELFERWMLQRERAQAPQHKRHARSIDDDIDYKYEIIKLLTEIT